MGNEASVQVTYGTKLLNNAKFEWTKVKDGCFPPRDGHCSASVGNKVYVFGGVRWNQDISEVSEVNETLVFCTETQTWSRASVGGKVPTPRSSASMTSIGNKLYMFGGLSRDSGWLNDLYVLDTDTMNWDLVQAEGNYPSPRDKLSAGTMGKKMVLFGGFGPKVGTCNEGEAEFEWFNDFYLFDPETNIWKKLMPSLEGSPTPRAAHSMCIAGTKIVIFGGRDSVSRRHDIYILDTESMAWESVETKGRQPEPRSFHACTLVGNRMVVFGGRGMADQHFNDLHIFDIDKREWLQPAVSGDVPTPRGSHSLDMVDSSVVLYGGSSDFDPETMQLQQYHGDTFVIPSGQLLEGESLGPDPNDVPNNQVNIAPQAVNGLAACTTIAETDELESEDEESSEDN
ncbi:tip elongation aberrant protein 1-like [Actinia tenebrosa]|uniref:Tip elongation aberrant protein 1-like n=1 Tax=Actinia tenebrosa TaxID=6105 RepID=A0A6P8IDM7_ACTTE|nr:tip elongation aberrant protein 1-like [Actinia tenebrosa]